MLDPTVRPTPWPLRRVLFLSANVGTGHSAAAENILKALRVRHPNVEGLVVDSFLQAHNVIGRVVEESYLQILKHAPRMYARLYQPDARTGGIRHWVNETFSPAFMPLIQSWQPDAIVCTHAFASGVCDVLRQKHGIAVPVIGVITDFVVHPFWLAPGIDMFALATDELAHEVLSLGVSPDRVAVTGIPINPCFGQPYDRSALRHKLGLSEGGSVVLVMGGGLGMEPVGHILEALKDVKRPLDKGVRRPLEVVVLTGQNQRLQARFRQALRRQPPGAVRFHVHGYIDNVHEFMQASDLLVTKPGGMTSAEALAAGLPMLLVKPIPGQEARNASYLISHKVALDVQRHRALRDAVEEALSAGRMLQKMKQRARAIGCPQASDYIASMLESMVARVRRPEPSLARLPKLASLEETAAITLLPTV